MEVTRIQNLPPPPGIMNSIRAGFDSIASHITAIFFPLLLNLFLWLGPRLRVTALFDSIRADMIQIWQSGGISAKDIQSVMDMYDRVVPAFNVFWLLRTFPIGISSLPFARELSSTPIGDASIWQVSGLSLFLWIIFLTSIGWVGGALYFRQVAHIALINESNEYRPISVVKAILQTVFVSIFCLIILAITAPVISFALLFLLQLNMIVTSIVILLLSFFSMWIIVPIFFLPHGVFVKKENIFQTMVSSFQLTRFTLPNSSLFVLTIFLLAYGLNVLWSIPSEASWLTLFAIFGHSFVTTALLAGSFIYYRDMTAWVKTVLEKLKPPVKQQA